MVANPRMPPKRQSGPRLDPRPRRVAGRRDLPPDGEPPPRPRLRSRAWAIVAGLLAASGLLAAVTAFVVDRYFEGAVDRVSDALGQAPLEVPLLRALGPTDSRRSGWASATRLPPGVAGATDHDVIGRALESAGYVDVHTTVVELAVRNTRSATATLTSIRAVKHRTAPALDASLVFSQTGGGQTEGPIEIEFRLNSPDLEAYDVESPAEHFLDANGLELAPQETLRFVLIGRASADFVEWTVQIEFILAGTVHTLDIGNPAAPFRITAAREMYAEGFDWTDRGLHSVDLGQRCAGDCRTALAR